MFIKNRISDVGLVCTRVKNIRQKIMVWADSDVFLDILNFHNEVLCSDKVGLFTYFFIKMLNLKRSHINLAVDFIIPSIIWELNEPKIIFCCYNIVLTM